MAKREQLCLRVVRRFQLPDLRLLCYIDDDNPELLRTTFGEFVCGLHVSVMGSGDLLPG